MTPRHFDESGEHSEVHQMAAFIHGTLASLHFVGIIFNLRRKNWSDVALHSVGVWYGVRSALHHREEA